MGFYLSSHFHGVVNIDVRWGRWGGMFDDIHDRGTVPFRLANQMRCRLSSDFYGFIKQNTCQGARIAVLEDYKAVNIRSIYSLGEDFGRFER